MQDALQRVRPRAVTNFSVAGIAVLAILVSACERETPFKAPPGEMVQFGGGTTFKGFEPVDTGDVASAHHVSNVYEGLLEYHYLKRPYEVMPVLCEEVPTEKNGGVSADGLTYTFKIKKGVRFHDDPCFEASCGKGREVTAHDFVYSFKRTIDQGLEPQGDWIFSEHVLGVESFMDLSAKYYDSRDLSRSKLYQNNVLGFQAPDDRTFVVKLKKPYPQLLWVLTMPYAFVVPQEAVNYYDGKKHNGERHARDIFRNHPVGTGPWIMKSWQFGYRMEYVRNPDYKHVVYPSEGEPEDKEAGRLDDAGKRLPICDRIILFDIKEESVSWQLFLHGDLPSYGIPRDRFDKVVTPQLGLTDEMVKRGISLVKRPSLSTSYIGFNFNDPVVGRGATNEETEKRKKLRQAIACAIDQQRLIKVLTNDRGVPASGPNPPGVPGELKGKYALSFDLERAKKLLAEAGYPDGKDAKTGKRLALTIDGAGGGSPEARQSAEMYTDMLRAIGIDLEVRQSSFTEYLRRTKNGETQMYWGGWVIDYPDAQNFLQLYYGPNKSPGINSSNYQNPEFDKLYEQILSMPDSPERTAIYEKMSGIVVDDVAWVMLYHPLSYGLYRKWLLNNKPHDFPYAVSKYIKIAPH